MVLEIIDARLPSIGSRPRRTPQISDLAGYSRRAAFITMVQAAQISQLDDASLGWSLRPSWLWGVLAQRQMGAPPMVIIRITRKVLVQRTLAEHDHMVQALTADRADQPFDVRPLPRRPRRRQHLLDPLRSHLVHELLAKDLIAIPQQVSRSTILREGFAHLLRGPLCSRMCRHAEVQNAPTVMGQHEEHV